MEQEKSDPLEKLQRACEACKAFINDKSAMTGGQETAYDYSDQIGTVYFALLHQQTLFEKDSDVYVALAKMISDWETFMLLSGLKPNREQFVMQSNSIN